MKPIDGVQNAHKLWSVQLLVLQAVLDGAWLAVPAFQDAVPPKMFAVICIVLALLILAARLIKQKDVADE